MKYVNAYIRSGRLQLIGYDGDRRKIEDAAPDYAFFVRRDVSADKYDLLLAALENADVLDYTMQGDWFRISCKPDYWDKEAWCDRRKAFGKTIRPRERLAKTLEEAGIPTSEADVSPIRRYISDAETFDIGKPRRLYFDIETDSRVKFSDAVVGKARVLSWAAIDEDGRAFSAVLGKDTDGDEELLLGKFWQLVADYDQLVAWNGESFDFPVMKERSRALGMRLDYRAWLWLDQMLVFKRNNIMSAESGEEKQSFALENIAQQILGYGKHDFDSSKTWQAWEADGESRSRLLAYNEQDAALLKAIEEKTGYIAVFQAACEVAYCFPDTHSLKPTVILDAYMLRLGRARGLHFKTKWRDEAVKFEKFPGALVMKPKANGIMRNVHVVDMASLYPSIFITFGLSPDTKDPEGSCMAPGTGLRTRTDREGIICVALKQFLDLRAVHNKRKASLPPGTPESVEAGRKSNAFKLLANSVFGCTGTPYSRFYDKDLFTACTQTGVFIIRKIQEAAEAKGYDVIYLDTDGAYITGASESEMVAFTEYCNTILLPGLAKMYGAVDCRLSLTYEKAFDRIVFVAAKKYAAKYLHYKGTRASANSKPEIKGLEVKRGDSTRLARELQNKVIDVLMSGEESVEVFETLVDEFRRHILKDSLSLSDVKQSKSLSKDLFEYRDVRDDGAKGAIPAHVRVARLLRERGEHVSPGTRIDFVIVDAECSPMKVIPLSDYDGTFDRHHVWQQQVYPATQRLLAAAFPNHDWSIFEKSRPSRSYNPYQLSLPTIARNLLA